MFVPIGVKNLIVAILNEIENCDDEKWETLRRTQTHGKIFFDAPIINSLVALYAERSLLSFAVLRDFVSRVGFVQSFLESQQSSQIFSIVNLAEVWFRDEETSLAHAISKCFDKCSRDVRPLISNHVLLSGGGCLPGLGIRLQEEISHILTQRDFKLNVYVNERKDRHVLHWKGASIVASVSDEGFIKSS